MLRVPGFCLSNDSLADHCDPVFAYPLDRRFAEAWRNLPVWRHDGREYARPRYDSLATALRALTHRPVALLHSSALTPEQRVNGIDAVLMSTEPFGGELHRAIRVWERAVRRGRDTITLTPLVSKMPEIWWPAEHLDVSDPAAPTIPHWVRTALVWSLTARVMGRVLDLGTAEHPQASALLADTDGSLLCWPLLGSERDECSTGLSMLRVTVVLSAVRRVPRPVVMFDARLVRIYDRWPGIHHAWIRPGATGHRALRIGVRPYRPTKASPWRELPTDYIPEVRAACGRPQIELPEDLKFFRCDVRAFGAPKDASGDDAPPPEPLRDRLHTLLVKEFPGLDPWC